MSKENEGVITDATVAAKVEKGEELTPEEQEYIKGNPNGEGAPERAPEAEEEPEAIRIEKPGAGASDPQKKTDDEKKEPAKSSAPAAEEEKPKQTPEERKALIERELEKPEAQQDLTQFSENEIGVYLDLKKERRKRQKAEEELEVLRVEKVANKLKEELKPEPKKEPEEDALAFLEGKADDDILTVAEAKKLAAALKKAPAPEKKPEAKAEEKPKPIRTSDQVRLEMLEAERKLKLKGIDDFMEVVDYAGDVLKDNEEAREELRQVALSGGNTAERTYFILKASPQWPKIKEAIETQRAKLNGKKPEEKKAPDDNAKRAERLRENEGKVKTTGPGNGSAAEAGEYTMQEIAAMTIDDIRRLPKATRQLILKKHGSNPNLSN